MEFSTLGKGSPVYLVGPQELLLCAVVLWFNMTTQPQADKPREEPPSL